MTGLRGHLLVGRSRIRRGFRGLVQGDVGMAASLTAFPAALQSSSTQNSHRSVTRNRSTHSTHSAPISALSERMNPASALVVLRAGVQVLGAGD
jgi:hypothetical protein